MAAKPLTTDQLIEVLNVVKHHGTIAAAARALGMSRTTLQSRWLRAKRDRVPSPAHTERSRLAQSRYRRSEKGKAAQARYRSTPAGRRAMTRNNQRRLFVGMTYQGRAHTIEQAAAIQSHIKERIRAFITRQPSGA